MAETSRTTLDEQTQTITNIPHEALNALATSLLTANNVSPTSATIIAQHLVAADLRGVDTHGILRLPSYFKRLRLGLLDPHAEPILSQITPCVGIVDGHNGFGHLSAHLAIDTACHMATTYGIGMVSVKHSNHFGMSAWICQRAIDHGFMSLVFTNSSPALPVYGGREKLLGVSPIACGAPAGKTRPFILDMAPSIAARGKVYKALRRGQQIPEDWALDKEGRATRDPAAALEGVMLPMGGPKGSALAIMMDVFSGVLSGSAFAGGVKGPYDTSGGEANVGHFIVAIKPDLFMDLEEFKGRMDYLYNKVVGSEKAAEVDRIYFPGEREQIEEDKRRETGIPLTADEIESLNKEADLVGVPRLTV